MEKSTFNRALASSATTTGIEIRAHSRAVTIQTDPQQVSIAVRERAGRQYTLRARLAILACGVRYRLAKQLGLGLPQEFLQGAQADIPAVWTPYTEIFLDKTLSAEAFGWIVPLETGWSRVGLTAGHRAHRTPREAIQRGLVALTTVHASVIGVLFNSVDVTRGYGYSYYYYYHRYNQGYYSEAPKRRWWWLQYRHRRGSRSRSSQST